jgi:calcineurin-like phosphoesterase family protein
MKERRVIRFGLLALIIFFFYTTLIRAEKYTGQNVIFGICADVHKDIMHDADARLDVFIREASKRNVDFIVELGDFCRPYDYNLDFLKIWNSFPGDKYHVIGNHEMDGGFSKDQVVRYLNSPGRYYSFDKNGYHFIVLDGNDQNPSPDKSPGYSRYIGDEQRNWLINDLKSTQSPVILFSHQSLENDGIENRQQIRSILESENKSAGFKKVIACFSGHHHTDYAKNMNGIIYIEINSMSYQWVGEKYQMIRFSKEIDSKYPSIKYTIPYKDPLYAFIEINDKEIVITGKKSSFVGPGPEELGMPEPPENNPTIPMISDRRIKR